MHGESTRDTHRPTGGSDTGRYAAAGTLFFIAYSQLIYVTSVAEGLYPGYSMRMNVLSDLGVQSQSALLWNASMLLAGVLLLLGAWQLYPLRARRFGMIPIASTALAGIGIAGVAIFNENYLIAVHQFFALLAFASGGVAALSFGASLGGAFRYLSFFLGAVVSVGIVALVFIFAIPSLGPAYDAIGPGFAERFVAYPLTIWFTGFGAYLIGAGRDDRAPDDPAITRTDSSR